MTANSKNRAVSATLLLATAAAIWLWLASSFAQAAPNVIFQTLKGESIRLEELRGKPVLVSFWATSCQSCLEEMPHLAQLYSDLHPAGFEIVAVAMSYDPPNRVLELTEALRTPYKISLDIDSSIATAFGEVDLTPSTFLVDPAGQIVLHKLGALDLPALRKQVSSYL